ncbi:MAG: tRNA pseudouridine(55) synthase TruB [Candidatus Omnitrophica bacterium]|nr:tRNA pseudouridine(55) synthase TruB [Candidatus Omnitrophota bacterium]
MLIVDKPQGLTSHDVVQLLRRRLGLRRIGHAGTLDPIATGVLVLLIGRATKHQQACQASRKVYEAVIQLGSRTDTGDAWGAVVQTAPVPAWDSAQVARVLDTFVGPMTQVPPAFSAVKVRGRPLYWWARHGTPVVGRSRTVEIFACGLLAYAQERLTCRLECSSGTYVRTLAEELAGRLGTVGHVKALVRLAVGPWDLRQAHAVPWLADAPVEELWAALRPIEAADAADHRA